jgi:drug/metabolite transporter (DMT)-like permease
MGVALALAVAGGLLVRLSAGGAGLAAGFRGGEILLLLGSGCWAWYSLACQRWLPGYSQLRITAITFLPGAAFLALLDGAAAAAGLTRASSAMLLTDALLVAWMAVSAGCLGVVFWHFGVSRLGLPMAALYLNGAPVVSLLLAIAFGVVPTWLQLVGALLVVAGVLQAQLRRLTGSRRGPWGRRG